MHLSSHDKFVDKNSDKLNMEWRGYLKLYYLWIPFPTDQMPEITDPEDTADSYSLLPSEYPTDKNRAHLFLFVRISKA